MVDVRGVLDRAARIAMTSEDAATLRALIAVLDQFAKEEWHDPAMSDCPCAGCRLAALLTEEAE